MVKVKSTPTVRDSVLEVSQSPARQYSQRRPPFSLLFLVVTVVCMGFLSVAFQSFVVTILYSGPSLSEESRVGVALDFESRLTTKNVTAGQTKTRKNSSDGPQPHSMAADGTEGGNSVEPDTSPRKEAVSRGGAHKTNTRTRGSGNNTHGTSKNVTVISISDEQYPVPLSERREVVQLSAPKHLFWKGRQKRFCKLIRTKHEERARNGSKQPLILNFTTRCDKMSKDIGGLGTGNVVLALYGMRLAAAAGGADLIIRCSERTNSESTRDILPWLQGYFPDPSGSDGMELFSPYRPPVPSLGEVCHGMGWCPFHYMSDAIRRDLRKMAVRLVGHQTGRNVSDMMTPLLSNVEIDDVAIHFRCGDLIKGMGTAGYGFLSFAVYKKYISPSAKSIGIVTTPFEDEHLRRRDKGSGLYCKVLVMALVDYLSKAFPRATISVRNNPEETVALAYARLVMANQSFCSRTTFAVFPAIASYGTSYIQKGGVNYFAAPIAEAYDDVHLINAAVLTSDKLKRGLNEAIKWLTKPSKL